MSGKGSQYAWGYLASSGAYLNGSKSYKLNLPKDPPAKQFISVVLYDPQTRSFEGDARDSFGSGHHGTVCGDPEFASGKEGQCLRRRVT